MTQRNYPKSLFILSMILIGVGDLLFFGTIFFKDFFIDVLMGLSPEYNTSDLSEAGKAVGLFYLATLGTLMYLIGFLVWALAKETLGERRKFGFYGLLVWFVTDTIVSLVFGFPLNVMSNLVFLVVGVSFIGFKFDE